MTNFTQEEINQVDSLSKELCGEINKRNIFTPELKLLLIDGIEALQNSIFFASTSIFMVFLEKYLRDILIYMEFKRSNPLNNTIDAQLAYLEEVERKIEDDKNPEINRHYGFPEISKKLYEYNIIDEVTKTKLITKYTDYRNPVQHGLYRRLVSKKYPDKSAIREVENTKFDKSNTIIEFDICNAAVRYEILPKLLKNESIELLEFLRDLHKKIEKNL